MFWIFRRIGVLVFYLVRTGVILYFFDEDGERWGRRAVLAIGRRIPIGQALHFLRRIG